VGFKGDPQLEGKSAGERFLYPQRFVVLLKEEPGSLGSRSVFEGMDNL